jgi:hypothetical protein
MRSGKGTKIPGCKSLPVARTAAHTTLASFSAFLKSDLVEGDSHSLRQDDGVVMRPEMHEEQAGLVIEHVVVDRRHATRPNDRYPAVGDLRTSGPL